jgi:NADH-quinone oxidoreductase subunit G
MTAPAEVPMLNVQIDGVWMQFPKGTRVIEACSQAGKFIPRYCYHPRLSAPGNCRMCLVEMGMPKMSPERKPVLGEDGKPEIAWIPRAQISCAQDVAEGMGVRTDSPMVKECREGVMEFLLINHPLDCPICDQAGECRLQEFSVQYGKSQSRFLERKVKKPKNIELGPRVTLDAERCVLCSRCIRFMREVGKDDVLGFVDRGSFSTIACHPNRTLDSNYSLNTVDICPVGALTSSDFRFKMRVWFLKETRSIDVNDGLGANIIIGTRENRIYRITPRENDAVNGCWIPDSHRLNFAYVNGPDRLQSHTVSSKESSLASAAEAAVKALRDAGAAAAIIVSARCTNEELFLASLLAKELKTSTEIVPRIGEPDGILIQADRNPNTSGSKLLGLTSEPGANLEKIRTGVRSGKIKALLTIGEDLTTEAGFTSEDLGKLTSLIAISIQSTPTTQSAHIAFAGSAWAEKRGSMVNVKGRLQRLNKALEAPGHATEDWEILAALLNAAGGRSFHDIDQVFHALSQECEPFAGLNLDRIGDLGIPLVTRVEATPANA